MEAYAEKYTELFSPSNSPAEDHSILTLFFPAFKKEDTSAARLNVSYMVFLCNEPLFSSLPLIRILQSPWNVSFSQTKRIFSKKISFNAIC